MSITYILRHHGAVDGVTGSCHQLLLADGRSILVDCGLFQGAETSADGAAAGQPDIGFPVADIQALVLTHVHIDHGGRIPHLLAAGFRGPTICGQASAILLPLVLEDSLKVGFTRDESLIRRFLGKIRKQLAPLSYHEWYTVIDGSGRLRVKLSPAGHILGSAHVQVALEHGMARERVVSSGDLGAPYTPLLPAPRAPYGADTLVLESTYGDRRHPNRKDRRQRLQALVERALTNKGSLLFPPSASDVPRNCSASWKKSSTASAVAMSPRPRLGISRHRRGFPSGGGIHHRLPRTARTLGPGSEAQAGGWAPPLSLRPDAHHRRPCHTPANGGLPRTYRPAIVIAASGMCSGGRMVNYLKAMLGDSRHDVLFIGYQAAGIPGRDIQQYGPLGGWMNLDGQRYTIRAGVHTLEGYSAHADQQDLLNFVGRMRDKPRQIRLVHGDTGAKAALAVAIRAQHPGIEVVVP